MAEKEYIERGALMEEINRIGGHNLCEWETIGVKALVERQPAADVVEVRHGEWVLEHEDYGKMMCSICKKTPPTERKPDPFEDFQLADFYIESPYCPHCGAKMDGGTQ